MNSAIPSLPSKDPVTWWFTGLSGAGKTTLAVALHRRLTQAALPCMVIDGDELRAGLCRDLGFGDSDRSENVRRAAEMAKMLNHRGCHAAVALVSPRHSHRGLAREIIGRAFREIHVSTSLAVCEGRDVKQLYRRARSGAITNFTGVSAPYEEPVAPDFVIDTQTCSIEDAVTMLLMPSS